ncbi:MAG: hypothetical protein GF332_03630 [Candidatus Moranbacteria bacterium]|nr:hypothetical protein [Candidatus Moranbacteria bacterium]
MLIEDGDYIYGILIGWGDIAYHLGMIKHLAVVEPFELTHSILGNEPLTYTFFINFVSAIFLRMGLNYWLSWHAPLLVFGIAFVLSLNLLGQQLLKRRLLALILVIVVLCGAGLGYLWFFKQGYSDFQKQGLGAFIQEFQEPSFEYTHLDNKTGGKPDSMEHSANIVWIVPLISFFSHQRSFNPGAFLAIISLFGVVAYRKSKGGYRKWYWPLIILPISHVHSFLSVGIIHFILEIQWIIQDYRLKKSTIVFKIKNNQLIKTLKANFFKYFMRVIGMMVFFVVIIEQILFIFNNTEILKNQDSSPKPWFGWVMCSHNQDWFLCDDNSIKELEQFVWFCFKNFGFVFFFWVLILIYKVIKRILLYKKEFEARKILIILLGLRHQLFQFIKSRFLLKLLYLQPGLSLNQANKKNYADYFILPSLMLFVIANVAIFQPWEFDNNKIIFYWWILAILIALSFFVELKILAKNRYVGYFLIGIYVILTCFAGVIDIQDRIENGLNKTEEHFGYYNEEDLTKADWISKNTDSNDVFLACSHSNNFVPILTGRSLYLGFHGWLWSQGNEKIMNSRFNKIRGFIQTGNQTPLCEDGVDYLLIDKCFVNEFEITNGFKSKLVANRVLNCNKFDICRLNCQKN